MKLRLIFLALFLAFNFSSFSARAGNTETHPEFKEVQGLINEVTHASKEQAHKPAGGVEPEKALQLLKNGNRRFITGQLRKDGASNQDVKRLSTGQKPHTIVISCSDSRVPPEIVFDQKLGEIFVVRTAGETLDPTSLASVEYALEHLGARNIVVLGHTSCGAVKAAFGTLNGADAGSENLNHLVQDIHPRIQQFKEREPSKNYVVEGEANARGVARELSLRSEIIDEKLNGGDIKITPALYDLEEGQVIFYEN